MNKKPQYQHDCDQCEFQGEFLFPGSAFQADERVHSLDLYTCRSRYDVTVILRYGDDGPQYMSSDGETAGRMREGNPLRQAWDSLPDEYESYTLAANYDEWLLHQEEREMVEQQADERVWRRKQ